MTGKHRTGDIERQREIKRLDGAAKAKPAKGPPVEDDDPPVEKNPKKVKVDFGELEEGLKEPGWRAALQAEFKKPYWADLQKSLQTEANSGACMYPFLLPF